MKYRIIYGVLWLLTVIGYSLPWASADGKVFTGWEFTLPFSITYFIGILLGLIVLITGYKPITMTIIAGVLMILGFLGAMAGYAVAAIVFGLAGAKVKTEWGMGLAFLLSLVYMVVGTYIGKKMIAKK